jgi:hypothetical protein
MRRAAWLAPAFCGLILATSALAGDLKSGPEVGKNIPGPFNPLHCNGPDKDKKVCLV